MYVWLRLVGAFNLLGALSPTAITIWQSFTANHWLTHACGYVSLSVAYGVVPIYECGKEAILTKPPSIWKGAVGGILLTLITTAFYVLTLAFELPSTFDTELTEQIVFGAQILLHFIAILASAFLNRRFARDLKALEKAFTPAVDIENKAILTSI